MSSTRKRKAKIRARDPLIFRRHSRSLLKSNSRGNSEITGESVRIINEELDSQISRKLDEMKTGLVSQLLATIDSAITEKVIPGIQESIDTFENGLIAKLDRQSVGLDRNTGGT